MWRKLTVGMMVAVFLICAAAEGVNAYMRYNPHGPDRVLSPGYQWTVAADTAANHALCLRWAVNQTQTWSHTRCVKTDTTAAAWVCTIPDEIPNAKITYQFYKGLWDERCTPAGNTWEWTPQHTFETIFDSVTLNQLNAQDPFLRAGLIGLLWVICGAIAIFQRHYRR